MEIWNSPQYKTYKKLWNLVEWLNTQSIWIIRQFKIRTTSTFEETMDPMIPIPMQLLIRRNTKSPISSTKVNLRISPPNCPISRGRLLCKNSSVQVSWPAFNPRFKTPTFNAGLLPIIWLLLRFLDLRTSQFLSRTAVLTLATLASACRSTCLWETSPSK